jgi:hypothetical protein
MALNAVSSPKKKIANTTVMMTTITAVIIVSRDDGHTTFAVSARTCRMNSPGVVFATVVRFPNHVADSRPAPVRPECQIATIAKSAA